MEPHRLKSVLREAAPLGFMILKCPICKRPTDSETGAEFPFCSAECRQRDLGNWASEKYKVAAPMMDESELEETETNERPRPEPSGSDDE